MYLGWEAKVEYIFNVYEVEEDQQVKLASHAVVTSNCNGHWFEQEVGRGLLV